MSVQEAIEFARNRQCGIGQDDVRKLTGGYSCQSIDAQVLRAVWLRMKGCKVTLKDFIV